MISPFVLEWWGAPGKSAEKLLDTLVKELDPREFHPVNWAARSPKVYWKHRFAVALWKGHARAVSNLHRLSFDKAPERALL